MVGLAGNTALAASSSCLATVLAWASREKAEKRGVGQGVDITCGRLGGDEGAGESDISSSMAIGIR